MGAKILAIDAISTGVSYGTSEICQAMGCPGSLTLVLSLLAGMGTSGGLGSKVFGKGGVTPDDLAYQRYLDGGVSEAVESGSYASPNKIDNLLDGRPELTGSTRDRLLSTVQDSELSKIVDQLYRQGAAVGDGGTAAILVEEFNNGASKHLIKATERLKQLRNLAGSGKLNLNDLDIAEALIDDLEYAVGLFD